MSNPAPMEAVRYAENYPFDVPIGSYSFCGTAQKLSASRFDFTGRMPVLTVGAHAAPSQLALRFPDEPDPIPVTCAVLRHYAVVYAGEFTPQAYLPPTLKRHRGAATYVFLLWLNEEQLEQMHLGEGIGAEADYEVLQGVQVEDEFAGLVDQVGFYLRQARPLLHRGGLVRVADVPSSGCTLPGLTQRAALRVAHRLLDGDESYGDFIQRLVEDPEFRIQSNSMLAQYQDQSDGLAFRRSSMLGSPG